MHVTVAVTVLVAVMVIVAVGVIVIVDVWVKSAASAVDVQAASYVCVALAESDIFIISVTVIIGPSGFGIVGAAVFLHPINGRIKADKASIKTITFFILYNSCYRIAPSPIVLSAFCIIQ